MLKKMHEEVTGASGEKGLVVKPEQKEETTEESLLPINTDELLTQIGVFVLLSIFRRNPLCIFTTLSMSFLWTLSAMSTLSPAYLAQTNTTAFNFNGILQEFNLTKVTLDPAEMTSTMFFIGNLLIGQICCVLADRYGRRLVLAYGLTFSGFIGVVGAFATSFYLLLFCRFCQGAFFTTITMTNWVLCCECIAFSAHSYASVLLGLSWVLGYCLVCPIAIVFPSWRNVQLYTSLPSLIFGVVLIFFLPESISWLIARRKKEEAQAWIVRSQKFISNLESLKYNIDLIIGYIIAGNSDNEAPKENEEQNVMETFRHILADQKNILYMACMAFLWVSDFLMYNTLSLLSAGVGNGNPHLPFLFSGLVEIPSYILLPAILDRFGRKPTMMSAHVIGAVAFLAMFVFDSDFYPNGYLALWMIAKFCMACTFMCCFIFGAEVFPVNHRNICLGLCATLSNFGAMLSPHSELLNDILPGMMNLFFAFLSICCALITLPLPETKHSEY